MAMQSVKTAELLVFGLSVLNVYQVLSAQHESYVTPVTIVATVHLAMLGALTFLAIRSIALNIYVQADLVTMIGLAAINGILIVEVAKQKLEQGLCITETAAQSGESPQRPILMTAMLTSRASCPLVMANGAGANSQQCLTFVMFAGLVVAMVLSLGVVSPVYVLVKNLINRLFARQDALAQQAKV